VAYALSIKDTRNFFVLMRMFATNIGAGLFIEPESKSGR
jgi:hypothetical protein